MARDTYSLQARRALARRRWGQAAREAAASVERAERERSSTGVRVRYAARPDGEGRAARLHRARRHRQANRSERSSYVAADMNTLLRRARDRATAGPYVNPRRGPKRQAALAATFEPNEVYEAALALREADPAAWARLAPATRAQLNDYAAARAAHEEGAKA